jgi:hypothetical protein
MIGVPQVSISRWERGVEPLPEKHIPRLAQALGVTDDELRGWKHGPQMTAKQPDTWRDHVWDAPLSMASRLILMGLPLYADEKTGVVSVTPDNLAKTARMDMDELLGAMSEIINSGFVRRIGDADYVFELTFPEE